MEALKSGSDVLFILLGGIMVLAMHSGFAFLELGTVRKKSQVNALVKILTDFLGIDDRLFLHRLQRRLRHRLLPRRRNPDSEERLRADQVLLPADLCSSHPGHCFGRHRRARQVQPAAGSDVHDRRLHLPLLRRHRLESGKFGVQAWLKASYGAEFHDFAGSVVVHAMGGWIALPAVLLLGARHGRYTKQGGISAHPPSSIPFLALGAWILTVGWFGFNVMSAQTIENISGLVAMNSLMAMVGGTLAALVAGKNDPGFVHNGPLAGLVAVCAGSDIMHPMGALVVGGVAGGMFVMMFTLTQNRWKIDDVLGVWPLHGLCGAWGGIAAGIFGSRALGGVGGIAFMPQLIMTVLAIVIALVGSYIVYGVLKATVGLRLDPEQEYNGADLSIHNITSTPERESNW
jgi:Amt family ammonium transporter